LLSHLKREEFKQLFDKNFDSLRNYIYYRSGDADLATDIAQETFMKVWEKQFDLQHVKIKSLLFKIAGDLFISRLRRMKVEDNYCKSLKFDLNGNAADEHMHYKELQNTYEKALAKLPDKQRIVFLMSRFEDLKYYEIAERLNITEKAVEKRMQHALSFLKTALQQ
jgi:RNA polymerase sigma-70 factor (family 1)